MRLYHLLIYYVQEYATCFDLFIGHHQAKYILTIDNNTVTSRLCIRICLRYTEVYTLDNKIIRSILGQPNSRNLVCVFVDHAW
jgi:hypothetical protein